MDGQRYKDEFNVEAVRQVTYPSNPVRDVAEWLRVTTHSLHA